MFVTLALLLLAGCSGGGDRALVRAPGTTTTTTTTASTSTSTTTSTASTVVKRTTTSDGMEPWSVMFSQALLALGIWKVSGCTACWGAAPGMAVAVPSFELCFQTAPEACAASAPGPPEAEPEPESDVPAGLPEMPLEDHVVADYDSTGLSLKAHPVGLVRGELNKLRILTAVK